MLFSGTKNLGFENDYPGKFKKRAIATIIMLLQIPLMAALFLGFNFFLIGFCVIGGTLLACSAIYRKISTIMKIDQETHEMLETITAGKDFKQDYVIDITAEECSPKS